MESSIFAQKHMRTLVALVLVTATAALAAYAYKTWESTGNLYGPTTINVRGEGEVLAKPDIGSFSFSVTGEGADGGVAQAASAEKINAIMAYLKEQGVEEKDIKTDYYNLNPKYRYDERPCAFGMYCPPSEPVIDGYEATQGITVKVRKLENSGALIAGVGEKGATNLSGLTFTIDDESSLKAEAREAAIADAKAKAEELAKNLNVRIVKMVGYYEEENYGMPYYGMGGPMMEKAMDSSVTPDMPTGENAINSVVNITYEVK